jgi:hypothetical protein
MTRNHCSDRKYNTIENNVEHELANQSALLKHWDFKITIKHYHKNIISFYHSDNFKRNPEDN